MVDKTAIWDMFQSFFTIEGDRIHIDGQGVVHAPLGTITDRTSEFPHQQIPIQFGHVYEFNITGTNINSWKGFPTQAGIIRCAYNKLHDWTGCPGAPHILASGNAFTSLKGIPPQVKKLRILKCPKLKNLQDVPELDEIWLTYYPDLPLLATLKCKDIVLSYPGNDAVMQAKVDQVAAILNKYAGEGKKGAIKCAAELIKAGFRENARW